MNSVNSNRRCGIVLAGGRGLRLRPFIHRLKGSTLPKQYVNFTGTRKERPVLEDAYRRMKPMNFADEILDTFLLLRSSQLSVLPVSEVFWSDWDSERAVVNALKQTGYLNRLHGVADARISAS